MALTNEQIRANQKAVASLFANGKVGSLHRSNDGNITYVDDSWISDSTNRNSAGSSSSFDSAFDKYLSSIQTANVNANELALAESERNRQFQERMSNTAHQREVLDLKKAGLNPVLSANSGASAVSGSTANISDSSSAMASILGSAINGLVQIANTQSNNATSIAINQGTLELQKMLGLANLDMTKYGIDTGYLQNLNTNQTALSVANINKQIAVLNNNEQFSRMVKQGDIDLSKIHTQGDIDILKSVFSGSGIHGEKDYINTALASAYLTSKGIILDTDVVPSGKKSSVPKNRHHR